MPEVLIVVHGLHQDAPQWLDCMWGNPSKNIYGRASRALRISEKYSSALLFLGGGGIVDGLGVSVAQATRELILQKASEMYDCSFDVGSCPYKTLHDRLLEDVAASNTQEEIENAFEVCRRQSVPKIILVSSPTHIARCLQEALVVKENFGYDVAIQACPSDVNYVGTSASDVVVIEPPHLPEAPHEPFHLLVRRVIPFMKAREKGHDFADEFEKLILRHEK